jgi:hypothetical protein
MDYLNLWQVLEELYNTLLKKGVTLPREIMDDLKSVKTLINIYKVDVTTLNVATEIEIYLEKIESNLLYLAESDIGKAYAEKWLKKIYEARRSEVEKRKTYQARFISGVPKNEHWIRIKTSDLMKDQDRKRLLDKFNLSSKPQNDEYVLIHGKEENIRKFIKEVGKKIKK